MKRLGTVARRPGGYRAFECIVVAAVLGAGSFGAVGLTAAMFGWAKPAVVWPVAITLCLAAALVWRPDRPSRADLVRTVPLTAILVGGLVIAASGITNALHNGQYVRADRDNGIYTSASFWIANHGDVLVDGRTGPYRDLDEVTADSIGQALHDGDDARLEIHGTHLFPSMVAQGEWLGGVRGIQLMPALLGVLALAVVFLFALWWLPPWLAVGAVTALALDFVFIYGVRSTLTEPTSLAFTFAGMWMVLAAARSERGALGRYAIGGAILALTLAVRVDAGAALMVMIPAVALLIVSSTSGGGRTSIQRFSAFMIGVAPILALAAFDLWGRSPGYASDLGGEISLIQMGFILCSGVAIGVLAVGRWAARGSFSGPRRWFRLRREALATLAAVGVLALFGALWFVRPLLGRVHANRGVAGGRAMSELQAREGFEADGTLTFAEVVFERLSWYMGAPVLILSVVGVALLVRHVVRRADGEAGLFLLGVLPMTLLYTWRPSIYPDQPWMMRRYLPVVIPGLLILAGVAVACLLRFLRPRVSAASRPAFGVGVGLATFAVFVLPPLNVTRPLAGVRWQAGGYQGIEKICELLGDDAIVLFANRQQAGPTLMSPVRSICDVPVMRPRSVTALDLEAVERVERTARADGRRLWLLARTEEDLREMYPDVGAVQHITVYDTTRVQPTLNLPPRELVPHHLDVTLAEVVP